VTGKDRAQSISCTKHIADVVNFGEEPLSPSGPLSRKKTAAVQTGAGRVDGQTYLSRGKVERKMVARWAARRLAA